MTAKYCHDLRQASDFLWRLSHEVNSLEFCAKVCREFCDERRPATNNMDKTKAVAQLREAVDRLLTTWGEG